MNVVVDARHVGQILTVGYSTKKQESLFAMLCQSFGTLGESSGHAQEVRTRRGEGGGGVERYPLLHTQKSCNIFLASDNAAKESYSEISAAEIAFHTYIAICLFAARVARLQTGLP